MKIRILTTYPAPRYPKNGVYVSPPRTVGVTVRDTAALLALAATLQSCGGGNVTSGVPIPPEIVSEAEARQLIETAFAQDSIPLDANRSVVVCTGVNDSLSVVVDGYNDSLKVGYDYLTNDDSDMTIDARQSLDTARFTRSPHILTITEVERFETYEIWLQDQARQFLDSLKALGII